MYDSTHFYWAFYRDSTMKVLHGLTGNSTGVLIYGFYTVSLGILQGFCYTGPTQFYRAIYRGSTIKVLHGLTGRSTGILLYRVLLGCTALSTGVLVLLFPVNYFITGWICCSR